MNMDNTHSLAHSHRISSIGTLLGHQEYFLYFIFSHKRPELRLSPTDLIDEMNGFSHGEQVLLRVALDMWSGSGEVHLWEILKVLDDKNFISFIRAIVYFRELDWQEIVPGCKEL